MATIVVVTGCTAPGPSPFGKPTLPPVNASPSLRLRAMETLRAAIHDRNDPAVRAEAVEALGKAGTRESLPWIRAALIDPHPGVRFAACVTIGQRHDQTALRAVTRVLADENCSVRAAALFALHRLGDESRTGRLPNYVLRGDNITCRRNAALVLGLLEEHSGIKVLARAMKDPDFGVRQHALEAMARLGNPEARRELTFMTSSGVGTEESFAIGALAATHDPVYADTYRYKLANAAHIETRLAAARALGTIGLTEGYAVATEALRTEPDPLVNTKESAAQQTLRIHMMAIAALGAIGLPDALPLLTKFMEDERDPHVRVSAAFAILQILGPGQHRSSPLSTAPRRGR